MSSLSDRYHAAEQKAEQQKHKQRMAARENARRKEAINNGRCFAVGRIICAYFPELLKYQPQYGDSESDTAPDGFVAVVELLSSDRKLLDWIKAEALNGRPGQPNPQNP